MENTIDYKKKKKKGKYNFFFIKETGGRDTCRSSNHKMIILRKKVVQNIRVLEYRLKSINNHFFLF